MKLKIIKVFFVSLLIISITGCSSVKKDNNSNNSSVDSNIIYDTSIPTTTIITSNILDLNSKNTVTNKSSNNSALEAYKDVLYSKIEFFSTDNKKKIYLNDFLNNKEIYETIFKSTRFTVLNMDDDKVVVLELSIGDEPEFYEVFHYTNGTVYGYLTVYRGLEELKVDGTFLYSSGAADNGVGKLNFNEEVLETDILGYSSSSQGNDNLIISYFIHNKPTTKESYDSFLSKQLEKNDIEWYDFTQENIETVLSIN